MVMVLKTSTSAGWKLGSTGVFYCLLVKTSNCPRLFCHFRFASFNKSTFVSESRLVFEPGRMVSERLEQLVCHRSVHLFTLVQVFPANCTVYSVHSGHQVQRAQQQPCTVGHHQSQKQVMNLFLRNPLGSVSVTAPVAHL